MTWLRVPVVVRLLLVVLLLSGTASAAEVWNFKREFLPALTNAVPKILDDQDKKTGRFGAGIWMVNDQHAMYPLAVAWATKIEGVDNPYNHDEKVLEAIMSDGDALIADQDEKGMWEFRKKDGSTWGKIYMPWTYSRWIRTFDLVKDGMPSDRRAKWEKGLVLGFTGIFNTEPKKPMQNIPVHNCMGLYLAAKIFNKPEWKRAAVDYLHACVKDQHPDGYWTEHKGPVVMYNGVYVDALGAYYGMSGDKIVLDALNRSAKFHAAMTYPDGRAVETVDERNSYHENIAGINLGFCFSPEGRAYVKRQMALLAPHLEGAPVGPEVAANFIRYGEEGELAPAASSSDVYVSGDKQVLTRRAGKWFFCMTSYAAEIDPRRWIQDRQNFLSLYHDDASLILGGGNTKMQPLWSTFSVGDINLLKHKAGDENPRFLPPPGLKHTPSAAALHVEENTLDLDYAGTDCSVSVDVSDPAKAKIVYTLHTPTTKAVAAHVPLIPKLKGKWSTASGKSGVLSDAPIDFKPGEAGEWFAHRGFRLKIPADASITWPALPHNPYAKDGKPELHDGRIVVTLPFSADVTRQEIFVELDEGTK
ncbi:MAG: hypothetical protein QOF78_4391 [Phycisphaerales bacterium]|nr:hypothetical protein [Phycisphaerales bacterium]